MNEQQLLLNQQLRCSNNECDKRKRCNRFLQLDIDYKLGQETLIFVDKINIETCKQETLFIEHDDNN